MTNNVFFRNLNSNAYNEAAARGVLAPANNNVLLGFDPSPIASITRGGVDHRPRPARATRSETLPVIDLDPTDERRCTANGLVAPNDGFFSRAPTTAARSRRTRRTTRLSGWTAARGLRLHPG